MEKFEVDLDTESIWLDDAWHTRDELAEVIQNKLKAGDYQIAQPSQAIELLSQAVGSAKDINVRITGEIFEALEVAAQDLGRSTSSIIRQLLDDWLFPKDEEGSEEECAQEDDVAEGEGDEAQEDEIAEDDASETKEDAASELDGESAGTDEIDDEGPFNESTPTGAEENVASEDDGSGDASDEFFQ